MNPNRSSSGPSLDTDTAASAYTDRLIRLGTPLWKRILDVQAPYRWNLRRLNLGFVLDIGCGIGRNLEHLRGHGIGIDHNPHSIEVARSKGLKAYCVEDFKKSEWNRARGFDSLLIAHVLEHLETPAAVGLFKEYLPLLKEGGKVVVITPQEKGQGSDATHVQFFDHIAVEKIFHEVGLVLNRSYSFPFPRATGRHFTYNEFVTIGQWKGAPDEG